MEITKVAKLSNNQQTRHVSNVHAIGGFESIEKFVENGNSLIVGAIKSVNAFPTGASRDLYCSYPTFGRVVDFHSDRILGIISDVLKAQNIRGNIQRRQQDEQFELLLECNDVMLERINSNLDELAGIRKNPQTILVEAEVPAHLIPKQSAGIWNINKKSADNTAKAPARLIAAKNVVRPQIHFKIPVDNSPLTPFEPRIKYKPNSLKPLAILPEYDDEGNIESYLHPYEFELMKFKPPPEQLTKSNPSHPKEIDKTPFAYIDSENKLKDLIDELRHVKELAVDVEHHSYRTFLGITCLLQISTREKDYIIDALKLRDELHALNEIFTNPKILKIFHGADLDVEWLQRDLSLYVVNMFDTHQAAKLLSFPRLSLLYLLKHYCNVDVDKTFQLADWRIRPLPDELITYARLDTHFLIYIYELIRNELLVQGNNQTNLLETVYERSTEICKKRFFKPKINSDSHMDLYRKSKRIFDNRQLFALKHIFTWRDKISRQEDESYGYVLPNHMMLQISESLPREMQGILACCNPIPPLVRQNLHALHQIILKAREQPLVKPIIDEQIERRVVVPNSKDYNNKLYCPQDLSHSHEFRDDLPTLLGPIKAVIEEETDIEMRKPMLDIFEDSESPESEEVEKKLLKLREVKFVTPYERYKAVIHLVEKQRLEEVDKENELNQSELLCPLKTEPKEEEEEEAEMRHEESTNDCGVPKRDNLKRKHQDPSNQSEVIKAKKRRVNDNFEGKDKFDEKPPSKKKLSKSGSKMFSISNTNEVKAENEISQTPLPSGSKKVIKKKKQVVKNKVAQSSNKPVEFDYSKVDFSKFKGGAQKTEGTKIKAKFHAKGKNNKVKNKVFNKLLTFNNVNKKK